MNVLIVLHKRAVYKDFDSQVLFIILDADGTELLTCGEKFEFFLQIKPCQQDFLWASKNSVADLDPELFGLFESGSDAPDLFELKMQDY